MKISENFFLQEFKANPQNRSHVLNYTMLAHFALEPIRKKFGGPVIITSGYRSPEYNKAIGGAPTSQHVHAEACDFVIKNAPMEQVFNFACEELAWVGQAFFYAKKGHVHLGLPRPDLLPTKKVFEV